jgi:chaperone required for assembly of F1-ATPase
MKRLFKDVVVASTGDSFSISLDDRLLRTPNSENYDLPTSSLAAEIAAEWQAQETEINLKSMPLTLIAGTAVDRVAPMLEEIVEEVIRYATTDLLCYRASEPAELVAKQTATWQPILDWASDNLGVSLKVTEGVVPIEQDSELTEALRARLAVYDHFKVAATHILTGALGSIFLALAVVENHIDVEQALETSQLDEIFQAGKWGTDNEAAERREAVRAEAVEAVRFLTLLQS